MFGRLRRILRGEQDIPIVIEETAPGQITTKGPGFEVTASLPSLELPEPVQLPPIVLDSPACPYCGVVQEPPPARRKKCLDCKKIIHTWTDQHSRRRYLLTQEAHARISQHEWEAKWESLATQATEGRRAENWHQAKMAYFQQALMLFRRGQDHLHLAAESRRAELRMYQDRESYRTAGVTRVTIRTTEDASCTECSHLHGQAFDIEEALQLMPIPVHTCRTWADKNEHGGWCRCSYSPTLPRD